MSQDPPGPTGAGSASDAVAAAISVVELGLKACEAYGRPDLGARLSLARRKLAEPGIHLVVAGEFKQGKSSLVNALIGAPACPVDDDIATAVPTYVRYAPEAGANLIFDGDPPRREPIPIADIRRHVVEGGRADTDTAAGAPVAGVEVMVPRTMLSGGLVVVDTPGLGGLGSVHAAATLAATSMADAVLFVTDASQELTRSELDFLAQARELCGTVACLVTKIDFYPEWRTVRDLDVGHLRRLGDDIPLLTVSSSLRSRAVQLNDTALNVESGFKELVRFVADTVAGRGRTQVAVDAAQEVRAVCQQLSDQFSAERSALVDPAGAQRVIDDLTATKRRTDELKSAAARWNQTLADGVGDMSADIEHDLRARIRQVIVEADEAIEANDPADTWAEIEPWLEARISHDLVANYTLLRDRSADLSLLVGEHFRAASGEVLGTFAVYNPVSLLTRTQLEVNVTLEKMTARKQTMVALKGSYSGILMFTMLPTLLGFTGLAPIAIPVGLMMGRTSLREEKRRQLAARQAQAKNAIRRYCDEVQFVMGKDSRDTLRRIQRQLRDHYAARAEELGASLTQAMQSASEAVKRTNAERDKRLRDVDAELLRLRRLAQAAQEIRG
ncbi:MAG: dynamin family protein [Kineosporiaceae bacterium]|nr:dynamin family protein [Kineosporiaceae bacterium]MBK7623088.1 dynamin family protein [Kineosporiaceae bacterium]MBK8074962.1 dynamin family protein [Kineosporiaceae bacterium]